MTAVDLDGFAQVAFAYSMMLAAQRDIDENGLKTINERGILIKNPAVAAYRDFFNMFYSIGGRYGLDPSARAKLINEQQDKPTDAASPLAGLIR